VKIDSFLIDYSFIIWASLFVFSTLAILYTTKKIIIPTIETLLKNHPNRWSLAAGKGRVIYVAPHLMIPILNIFFIIHFPFLKSISEAVYPFFTAYFSLSITFLLHRFIIMAEHLLNSADSSYASTLRSYSQFASLIVMSIGGIVSLCLLINISPVMFLGSLGAATAVLTLVFKDTILSLMASIQISIHKLISKGDYIRIDSCNVEGTVMDISLNFIQVKNPDETITVLPTHKLFQSPFKNWHNIHVVQTRRIKKAIFIDQESIVALTPERIEKYKQNKLIQDQLGNIEDFKTNCELFREYVESILKSNPHINTEKKIILRALDPTSHGVPLELSAFTKEFKWIPHEKLTTQLLEIMISLVHEFDLKIYQGS